MKTTAEQSKRLVLKAAVNWTAADILRVEDGVRWSTGT